MTAPTAPEDSITVPAGRGTLAAFAAAIFVSAFLLFSIQPMFTKMVLPQLGGSPAVWSVAMVFFQALLLAGYGYAHLSTRHLTLRTAMIVHLVLLVVTAFVLPIAVSDRLGEPPAEGQAFWLIGVFLLSVGLPFFAVSGNGPLLQAWFARSGHPWAKDPYFLYGASNLGSFGALLLYPIAFEPLMRVKTQSLSWSGGFLLLIALIALAAFVIRKAPDSGEARREVVTSHPAAKTILGWIALSFIPSGLLVAVTAHISTDIASAPFIWVMPLALFLLTFVLIFRDKPPFPMGIVDRLMSFGAAGLVVYSYYGFNNSALAPLVHVAFFFLAALVCHFRLYAMRPAAEHLTAFYLWMSFGGVLGGLFCGLIAPFIFDRVLEYPILVVAAVAASQALWKTRLRVVLLQIALVLALGVFVLLFVRAYGTEEMAPRLNLVFLFAAFGTMVLFRYPAIVLAMLPLLLFSLEGLRNFTDAPVYERSFFGVHKIELGEERHFRLLAHGTTLHGAQRILNDDGTPATGRPIPLTYYHPDGAMAASLNATAGAETGRTIGVVGLGTGAHACNGAAKDRWTYFEIDALVVRIARDPRYFTFLRDCAPDARIVLGDARLTLAKEANARFDHLVIDAFSSDAIPMHLMTEEAFALYLSKLKEGGILTVHISNRHLELESVVAALARQAGVPALIRYDNPEVKLSHGDRNASVVVALAHRKETLEPLAAKGWVVPVDRGGEAWTDDFSNILGALWRHYAK